MHDEDLKDRKGNLLHSVERRAPQLCVPGKAPRMFPRQWKSERKMKTERWKPPGPSPLRMVENVDEEKKRKMEADEEPQARKKMRLWVD